MNNPFFRTKKPVPLAFADAEPTSRTSSGKTFPLAWLAEPKVVPVDVVEETAAVEADEEIDEPSVELAKEVREKKAQTKRIDINGMKKTEDKLIFSNDVSMHFPVEVVKKSLPTLGENPH